jgi:hypothetical protein
MTEPVRSEKRINLKALVSIVILALILLEAVWWLPRETKQLTWWQQVTTVSERTELPPPALRVQSPHSSSHFLGVPIDDTANSTNIGKICFIHVGKTAGSSIACALGFKYAQTCTLNNSYSSELSERMNGAFHQTSLREKELCDFGDNEISTYLFSLRNPLYRMKSWFEYEHGFRLTRNASCDCTERMVECFPTFDEFCTRGLRIPDNDAAKNETYCAKLAWHTILGKVRCCHHNTYNFAHYQRIVDGMISCDTKDILPQWMCQRANRSVHILSLRTEYLIEDWDRLDRMLGGTGDHNASFLFSKKLNVVASAQDDDSPKTMPHLSVSVEGVQNLCRALCSELQVYKHMIFQSENLSERQKQLSILELQAECPEETYEVRHCTYVKAFF